MIRVGPSSSVLSEEATGWDSGGEGEAAALGGEGLGRAVALGDGGAVDPTGAADAEGAGAEGSGASDTDEAGAALAEGAALGPPSGATSPTAHARSVIAPAVRAQPSAPQRRRRLWSAEPGGMMRR
jgi:hypothetical protein